MFNFIKRLFGLKPESSKNIDKPIEKSVNVENTIIDPTVSDDASSKPTITQTPVNINSKPSQDLNLMTVNQLLDYAAQHDIEVKKSWRKAKIVETITSQITPN
jgi:hypothetical protein